MNPCKTQSLPAFSFGVPQFVAADDPAFPVALKNSKGKPLSSGLWIHAHQFNPCIPAAQAVAIVGSRAADRETLELTRRWAGALAAEGYNIVSGGALGVDAAAHEGALAALSRAGSPPCNGGGTWVVLGAGIDVVYPDRHGPLFRQISRRGALLSEYGPGVRPHRGQFPVRNRLVVGLADTVIITHAALRSGALITARLAQRLGRRLLARPGSSGCDWLLARGAAWPVSEERHVFDALQGKPSICRTLIQPSGFIAELVDAVALGATTVPQMVLTLARPVAEVMAAISEAELEGWVVVGPDNRYEVNRGCD